MTSAQITLHLGTAQVEIAVLEPNFLGGRLAVGNLKRHRRGRAESLERAHRYFDFAGRQLRVDGALGAADDLALHRNIKLGARLAGSLMRLAAMRRIQYELHDPVAIAKIDKDKPAMIAPRLHPSPQRDLAANIGSSKCAAVISARPRRQRRILLSFRHHPSQLRTGCGHRISLPASVRNSQTEWSFLASIRDLARRLGLGNFALS